MPDNVKAALPIALLVEDEALVAIIAEESLRAIGFEPILAVSAAAAREAVASGPAPVIALVDMGLPDGRGDELIPHLRAKYPDLGVIVASGYDEADLRATFKGDRSVVIVTKPYTELDLARAIQSLGITVAG